jgi:hypothetical protein
MVLGGTVAPRLFRYTPVILVVAWLQGTEQARIPLQHTRD